MKKVLMFMMATCPYCQKAIAITAKLLLQDPYKDIEIEMIDETVYPDIANKYDYFYVPTYYVDGKKLHEGAADEENIKAVLHAACEGLR